MSGLHHFPEEGIPFQVEAPYSPMGDQPKAIQSLAEGIERGEWAQVLLGATGTGKHIPWPNSSKPYKSRL